MSQMHNDQLIACRLQLHPPGMHVGTQLLGHNIFLHQHSHVCVQQHAIVTVPAAHLLDKACRSWQLERRSCQLHRTYRRSAARSIGGSSDVCRSQLLKKHVVTSSDGRRPE